MIALRGLTDIRNFYLCRFTTLEGFDAVGLTDIRNFNLHVINI